jgi:hypothetical protein
MLKKRQEKTIDSGRIVSRRRMLYTGVAEKQEIILLPQRRFLQ